MPIEAIIGTVITLGTSIAGALWIKIASLEKKNDELQARLRELIDTSARAQSAIKHLQQEIDNEREDRKRERAEAEEQINQMVKENKELREQVERLRVENAELKSMIEKRRRT